MAFASGFGEPAAQSYQEFPGVPHPGSVPPKKPLTSWLFESVISSPVCIPAYARRSKFTCEVLELLKKFLPAQFFFSILTEYRKLIL